jgi:hypothetical protein
MRIFVIPGKVLNDGFAIDHEFECLLIDGKVFVLGHDQSSVSISNQLQKLIHAHAGIPD